MLTLQKKFKNKLLLSIMVSGFFFQSETLLAAAPPPISLEQAMQWAERNSDLLTAEKLQEIVTEKSINVEKANYFPTLSAEGIESTGFPASNNLLGVNGLMGSPYRSGLAGGVVAEQTLYDFGRTSGDVNIAKSKKEYAQENTKVTEYQVKQLALDTYFDCENFRTQRDTWKTLQQESSVITKEVNHFVQTGQRSIVDGYLSETQTKEAQTAKAFYAARLKESVNELAVIMGVSSNRFSCPVLPHQLSLSTPTKTSIDSSAIVMRAEAAGKVAQQELSRQKAGYYPTLIAQASAGGMQSARLVPINDYALGIGLSMPLFDMSTHEKVGRAEAEYLEKEANVSAKKQYIEEMNGKYDEIIHSAQVKIKYLTQELQLSNKAFSTAKERYFSLQGTLIDLREAFDSLSRTQSEINNTRTELLKAQGEKVLLNSKG